MACFEDEETENLDACLNQEIQAGLSEIALYYAIHAQILNFPMPPKKGDPAYNYESSVTVATPITFIATKGWGRIVVQADSGELALDLVGNKSNKKEKNVLTFYVPGNDKKTLGFIRSRKNTPMVFCATERDGQKRLVGDKFNPAYMTEVKGTTGKGGEDDKGVAFTIESYAIPLVYESTIQLPTVANPEIPQGE